MFRDLIRGALETLQCSAGEIANYARGNATVEVSVLPGQVQFPEQPTRQIGIASDLADWLMPADELVLSGQTTLPQKGDRLTLTRDGRTLVYEVMPRQGEQVYRMDGTGVLLRIHTQLRQRT